MLFLLAPCFPCLQSQVRLCPDALLSTLVLSRIDHRLGLVRRDAYGMQFLKLASVIVHHDYANAAGPILFSSYKHDANIVNSHLASP